MSRYRCVHETALRVGDVRLTVTDADGLHALGHCVGACALVPVETFTTVERRQDRVRLHFFRRDARLNDLANPE